MHVTHTCGVYARNVANILPYSCMLCVSCGYIIYARCMWCIRPCMYAWCPYVSYTFVCVRMVCMLCGTVCWHARCVCPHVTYACCVCMRVVYISFSHVVRACILCTFCIMVCLHVVYVLFMHIVCAHTWCMSACHVWMLCVVYVAYVYIVSVYHARVSC